MLYLACSAATALLELANYLPSPRLVPADYRLGVYSVPDDAPVDTLPRDQLPERWAEYPYPAATQTLGDGWLVRGDALILRVPSAAVSGGLEDIALVNPNHEACGRLRLIETYADLYNERTFGGVRAPRA